MKRRFKVMKGEAPPPVTEVEYRRIPTPPANWYPMPPERRRLWDYCGFIVHMMNATIWMTPHQIHLECDKYTDDFQEPRIAAQFFWNCLAVAVQGGFAEVRVRETLEMSHMFCPPPEEEKDGESLEKDGESLADWR